MMRSLTKLFDLISPRLCVVCGHRLTPDESVLCAHCHLHMPFTNYHTTPLDNPMARLFWGLFPVQRVTALFFYRPKSDTSRIIYDIKYHGHHEVATRMGIITANVIGPSGFFDGIDAIVPVPLTRRRKRSRGYNQSEEFAQGLSMSTGIPVLPNAIKRIHFDSSQTQKSAMERRNSVQTVFQLADADAVKDKHILVVDDIVTTGATLSACATELCKAGGVTVSILSLGFTKS